MSLLEIEYKGERELRVVSVLEEHAEVVHAAVELSHDNLKTFMEWAHEPSSVEFQRERAREIAEKGLLEFAVFEGGSFVMMASLHPSKTLNRNARNVGYWTVATFCNQGLATLVTQILVVTAFEHLGCDRVEIDCNQANDASRRVIEKCGFVFEGLIRNFFTFPTIEMLRNGYTDERNGRVYSLLHSDVENLPWYRAVKSNVTVKKK